MVRQRKESFYLKRKNSILKPLILSILSFLIILVVVIYAFDKDRVKQPTKVNSKPPLQTSTDVPTVSVEDKNKELDTYISEIFSLAKEGKVVNTPFISGKTKIKEVQ